MTQRDEVIAGFLAGTDWVRATRCHLAGDASNRRYERLSGGPGDVPVVLMDAAPDRGEDVRPFLAVAQHLSNLGLSAPRILVQDVERGLLIIEDLGDGLYARVLQAAPDREAELYGPAVEVIADLAAAPPPGFVKPYAPDLVAFTAPAFDWYRRGATAVMSATGWDEFAGAFAAAVAALPPVPDVLILRDYHAENLIWLQQRTGPARVGLLDFQDALAGHPVYDLVSLLEDARRDVSPETATAMRQRFSSRTGIDRESFDAAAAVMALQRNLRILGIFARLSLHHGKPDYVDLIPRVWRHIQADLQHPLLDDTAAILRAHLPQPDSAVLARLKALCGTVPTP